MAERMASWRMVEAGRPLELVESPLPVPGPEEVLLRVRACGLCHTDKSFLYGGVAPRAPLPLTLGHEIVGEAITAGPGAEELLGQNLLVPAVLPCGECDLCRRGRGNVCRQQRMPGNDFHGGFASHFLAPARFLCPLPGSLGPPEDLAVVADAVSTAYQSVARTGVGEGDLVVIVGAGGVGGYAAQCAKASGAHVIAIDVDRERLEALGAAVNLALDASDLDRKGLRRAVLGFEAEQGLAATGRTILECSGTRAGQETAWSLLTWDATLVVVGFTREKIELRLSNLMAFDATAFGNWGCTPERFPEILELVGSGSIRLEPFVERHPMSHVNELLRDTPRRRPVLIPDFENL